jgi:hypothetical protein
MKKLFQIIIIPVLLLHFINASAQSSVINPYGIAGHGHYWDEVESTNVGWARMWSQDGAALWGEIQPTHIDSFFWDDLDTWVKEIDSNGYHMILTIRTGGDSTSFHPCKWTDVSFDSTVHPVLQPNFVTFKEASFPPKDYREWYNFVYAIVERYDGNHSDENGVRLPAILYFETQAENDIGTYWYGTKEEYYNRFLPVFYRAVHDANQNATVIGGSITDKGIGLAIIDSMIKQGVDTATIVNYYRTYFYGEDDITWADILSENSDALIQRRVEFVTYSFRPYNDTVFYDKRGFHNYVRYNHLRDHIAFERKSMASHGYTKDLWGTEVGIFDPLTFPDAAEDIHAQHYQKKMILQFTEGVEWFCFAPMTANPNDVTNIFSPMYSLKPFQTPVAREIRDAFAFVAGKINGESGYFFNREDTVDNVNFYQFISASRNQTFIAAWSQQGDTTAATIDIPDQLDTLVAYNYLGTPFLPAYNDSLTLTYTPRPVFIEWKAADSGSKIESLPNPHISTLKIHCVEIFNSRGQLVKTITNGQYGYVRIGKRNLAHGLYLIKERKNNALIATRKLVY